MLELIMSVGPDSIIFADAASDAADKIVGVLRGVIGPFLLLYIGIKMFGFFAQQQMMPLLSFLVIAIVVCLVFYTPGILKKIAKLFTNIV